MQAFFKQTLSPSKTWRDDFIYGTVSIKIRLYFVESFFCNVIIYKHKYACYHKSQWLLIFLKYSPTTFSPRFTLDNLVLVQDEEDVLHGSPGRVSPVGGPP
jgi:hypothetical protein